MGKRRLYKFLSRVVEVKHGEEIISLFLFFYFFLITAPFTIIKSLRDARYLDVLKSKNLPYAYATAFLVGLVVAFHSKLQIRIRRHLLFTSSLIFFIGTCLLFWFFLPKGKWLLLAYWMWAQILVVVLVTQFWILVNDIFNPREARRLIGFFVSGGILGGIVGGMITYLLAEPDVSNYDLLLIASGLLIGCVFVVNSIFLWQKKRQILPEENTQNNRGKEPQRVGFKDCFDTVRKDYYLKLLALVVLFTGVVSIFIDWQSKRIIEVSPSVKNNLTAFFGLFNTGLLVFAFLLQILMTSSIIKRYGIRLTLLLYPLILLFCSLGVALWQLLGFAIAIKASDKSLSFSINQSARELLYIPVSPDLKYKAKIFIDMFLNRFADSIGAVLLLVIISLLHRGIQFVSFMSALFIFGWIILNLKVSKEYTNTVKQKLEMKWERADRTVAEKMDIDYTKLVFDTLESKNRSSVLYAMHLFDLIKQDKLTPELRKLISYKSDEMKASSLGVLFESRDTTLFPETEDFISDKSIEKDVKEIMSLDVYQELMKNYFEEAVGDKSREGVTAKMELAKAIGLMDSHSPLAEKLEELLLNESPEVSKYAIESAANLKKREYIPAIVHKLQSPLTREDSISALEKYGQKIVGTLSDYLGDATEDIELRKAVVSVLAHIGTQDAADFLCWELSQDEEEMNTELIDALDKIRSEKPEIQFQEDIVKAKIIKEIKTYYRILIQICESRAEGRAETMFSEKNLDVSLMNIFKLLGVVYSHEDIAKAYQNIRTGTKNSVAYAVELLDNILHKDVKDIVLPLVEDLSPEERAKRCRNLLKTSPVFRQVT